MDENNIKGLNKRISKLLVACYDFKEHSLIKAIKETLPEREMTNESPQWQLDILFQELLHLVLNFKFKTEISEKAIITSMLEG